MANQTIIIALAVLAAASITGLYIGVFDEVMVRDTLFEGGEFYYKEYVGDVWKIERSFRELLKDTEKIWSIVSNANVIGIYYDDPSDLVDSAQSRAVYGILIPHSSTNDLVHFDSSFNNTKLPAIKAVNTITEYKGWVSFLIMAWKVYPRLYQSLKATRPNEEFTGALEIYRFENSEDMKIETLFVYGDRVREYFLTTAPTPAYKSLS